MDTKHGGKPQKAADALFTYNIALVGAVSCGKSTFLNTIFADTYSDMNIERTTMNPQIYTEGSSPEDNIYAKNVAANQENVDEIGHVQELFHTVPYIENDYICHISDRVPYRIYDIPGLNDAKSDEAYYTYIKNNVNKFDRIVWIIDIYSALNTSDERKIMNMLKPHSSKVICVVNKMDEPDDEKAILFCKIENILESEGFGKKTIFSTSCKWAYIYKNLRRYVIKGYMTLPEKYAKKYGKDTYGSAWESYSKVNQKNLLKKFNYEYNIAKIGFENLEAELFGDQSACVARVFSMMDFNYIRQGCYLPYVDEIIKIRELEAYHMPKLCETLLNGLGEWDFPGLIIDGEFYDFVNIEKFRKIVEIDDNIYKYYATIKYRPDLVSDRRKFEKFLGLSIDHGMEHVLDYEQYRKYFIDNFVYFDRRFIRELRHNHKLLYDIHHSCRDARFKSLQFYIIINNCMKSCFMKYREKTSGDHQGFEFSRHICDGTYQMPGKEVIEDFIIIIKELDKYFYKLDQMMSFDQYPDI